MKFRNLKNVPEGKKHVSGCSIFLLPAIPHREPTYITPPKDLCCKQNVPEGDKHE